MTWRALLRRVVFGPPALPVLPCEPPELPSVRCSHLRVTGEYRRPPYDWQHEPPPLR